jgi:protease-4
VHPVYIERESSAFVRFLRMLTGNSSSSDDGTAAVDPFGALKEKPDLVLARALGDARRILSGPAVQARCLACGNEPPSPADLRAARAMMAKAAL